MGTNLINQDTVRFTQADNELYDTAISYINNNEKLRSQYAGLAANATWRERFNDYLKGKKTLPLLYDPFFKTIFSQDIHKERLADLISAILGQRVTVVEVIPNEDATYMGMLIIMDILVKMSDGSLADIEVQKAAYLFPAERISCYSSDLMMRQYNKLRGMSMSVDGRKFSYKDLRKVHTIVFFEKSSDCLVSKADCKQYFHVGKTKFNTDIEIELLQDFNLISLDTFKEYRYPTIINGNVNITGYDCDDSAYCFNVDEELKNKRLMYLSLLVTDTVSDMEKLLAIYPELEGIVSDMNYYLTRPEEVLNMFSEALRILDMNSMELLIDEMAERAEQEKAKAEQEKVRAEQEKAKADRAKEEAEQEKVKAEQEKVRADQAEAMAEREKERADRLEAEIARLKEELADK